MNTKSIIVIILVIAGVCTSIGVTVTHLKSETQPPLIENSGVSNITTTSATLWADYDVGSQLTKIRFGYSENSSATWYYTDWSKVLGSARFSKSISGLKPNTCYKFKTFLQYDSTTLPGPVKMFKTNLKAPVLENLNITVINKSSAMFNVGYNCGSYPEIEIWFSYKEIGREFENTERKTVSGSGVFSENISGLAPGMVYEVKAVVKYDNAPHPSNIEVFQTPQVPGELSVPNFEAVGTEIAVADGDTIYVALTWVKRSTSGVKAGSDESVRFAGGMNAPEDPSEEGGPEATKFVMNLCPPGTEVLLDLDNGATYGQGSYRDIHGRLLAVIYIRKDNTWINVNAQELKWGMKAYPNASWDKYTNMPSEFSLYEWPPYDNTYPYVI